MSSSSSLERGEKGSGHIWNIGFYAPFFGQGPKHFSRTGIVISKKIPSFLKQNASFAIREKKSGLMRLCVFLFFDSFFSKGKKFGDNPQFSPSSFHSKRPPYNFPRFSVKLEIPYYNKEILLFCLPPHPPVWTITQQKNRFCFSVCSAQRTFPQEKTFIFQKKQKLCILMVRKIPDMCFAHPSPHPPLAPIFISSLKSGKAMWAGSQGKGREKGSVSIRQGRGKEASLLLKIGCRITAEYVYYCSFPIFC